MMQRPHLEKSSAYEHKHHRLSARWWRVMNDVRDHQVTEEKDEFKLLLLQVVIFFGFFYTLEKCYLSIIIQMTEEKTDIATLAWGCLYLVSTV